MKRSEINRYIVEAKQFFAENKFYLPDWADWSADDWSSKGKECIEIVHNCLGWDITDFGKGDFSKEGLTLITLRNGNVKYDNKVYCEKIMMVREGQVTPLHFHWHKMEDIINRGGGELCMKLYRANNAEELSNEDVAVQVDGVTIVVKAGEVFRLRSGQSITYEPYIYHTFWAEGGDAMIGEVSTVNDDSNDNRFYEPTGRYPELVEDEPKACLLCNEYPELR